MITRRLYLLAILLCCLLGGVTSADAQCAWVLWLEQTVLLAGQKELNWVTVGASTNIQDCDQQLRRTIDLQGKPKEGDKIERRASNMLFITTSTGMTMISRYVCLPDTVDPRGPKGK